VDTTAPSVPIITSPANKSYSTDGKVIVSGTAEANSTVKLFEEGSSQPVGTTTAGASSGSWSITLPSVAEGSHTYTAIATDAAGNASSESEPRTVIVDKSVPTLESVSPDNKATGVSRAVKPEATFSDAMDLASLKTSVKLYKRKSGKWRLVKGTEASCADDACRTARLDPYPTADTDLTANKKYKVVVTTGAKNVAGIPLASNKSWTFTTGAS
jgi:hypothetical protein